ncbi:MAG: GerMN domain-containing protein [Lachnospiraceae bacterium]|nr:GerMN domain-containing protein [Lachnospiraceae bacterium]
MKGKLYLIYALAAIFVFLLPGCGSAVSVSNERFGVYYINSKQTALVKENYTIQSDVTSEKVQELLRVLSTDTMDEDYSCPIPQDLSEIDFELADGLLLLHFDLNYYQFSGTREVLMRGAVVKTFLQLDEVSSVSFYVADEPLKDTTGNVVGAMTAESFLDTFGEKEEALESDTFTLYYSTEKGQGLIKKTRLLHFNNTMSRESVVLSYLARDPGTEDGAKAVLSPNTKVLSVTTKDGICYVKLDASFLNQQSGVATETAVYGIVDSLAALNEINKVELSVENTTEGIVPESDTVSGIYEPDESLVKSGK